MSNILKSTKLDIALVKPYFKTICFTLLLPIVFAAINRSLLTGVSFAMCFIAMTTGYTFSITEKNSMDRLFGILPVRKSELVIGRYVFVLAMGLLSLIISLIVQPLVLKVLGETVGVFDIVTAAIAGVFLFALYTVFQIPGYYKYGSIKGRVFMYIPVAGFLITLLLITKSPVGESKLLFTVINSPILLMLLAVIFVIAMYVVSILVSIKILKNREM
ncbi:ABC-2 transporter permease [bacterium 1xD8-48]|nr:ABC-2 transporter permease [bacterium 1xD8-48]